MKRKVLEKGMRVLFLLMATVSILSVLLICIFMLISGVPAIREIGLLDFLLGSKWSPSGNTYGIFPMIVGSVYVTGGAILVGVPVGLLAAIFLARFCPRKIYRPVKTFVDILAGIPSIVYGFFGMTLLVPLVRTYFGGNGNSILTASLLLGLMILPTVISITESSLRAVPESYYEGALALGATKERAVMTTVFPAAKSGIMAGIVLGIGRAIGETMAVIMVVGNQSRLPSSILDGVRTLTTNIVLEMGYAEGLHREALIATGLVLFVFILIINLCFSLLNRRKEHE